MTIRFGAAARNVAAWHIGLIAILSWLPVIRCLFDGRTYIWGQSYYGVFFRAEGINGDFGVLVLQLLILSGVVFLALRRPGRLSYAALLGVYVFFIGDLLWTFANDPSGLIFHGDTLDVEANVGLVFLTYFIVGLILSVAGYALEQNRQGSALRFAWTRANTAFLLAALAPLPAQYWLLHFGEPHGPTDEIGVIITMVQWVAILFAIQVGRRSTSN